MATEVDSQEPISLKIKEGEEDGSLTPLNLTFNQHPLGEMKELESMHNQPLETTNYEGQTGYMEVAKDIELDNENTVDVKEVEGEFFLQSPLLPKFATKGTSSAKKDYEASDIPNLEKGEMSKNETLVEEQVIHQYSDTVATKEASREENLGGLQEDRSKGSQDDEKRGIMTDENNESESDDQIVNIQEANSGQSTGGMIHKLDMTEGSQLGTGKLPETCDIEVKRDITLSTTTESSEESLRESNYQSGVDKESELSFISEVEKMNPEAIKPSKGMQEDKKDREDMLKNTEDVYISTKSVSTVKQNEEAKENGEGDTVSTTLMNELIEETIAEKSQKAAPDEGGDTAEEHSNTKTSKQNLERFLDVASEEIQKSTPTHHADIITYSEEKRPTESLEKNSEEEEKERAVHLNEIKGKEIQEQKNLSKDDLNENIEIAGLHEIANETYEANPTVEEIKQLGCGEQDKANDAISIEQVCEENKILTEKEKHVNETYEESRNLDTITYSEEKRPTESLEENLEEEENERIVHLNEIKEKEIPEEKNLSKDDLNENVEIAEVASFHETANETYETNPSVEEIKRLGCGEQDQVSKAVMIEQVCEKNKLLTEEEKHINETYEESGNLETITYFKEQRPTESLEENLEEEENERTIHLNEIKEKEIPEENNLSKDDLNEDTRIAKVVSLHETANKTYETNPPVKEIKQLGCGEQNQVSKAVPIKQVFEEDKHVNEAYKEKRNLETITYSEEKRPTESLEENLEEEEKDRTHLNEIKGKEIPEEKSLLKDDLTENIEIAEVVGPHEIADATFETDPPVEEIKQLGCRVQDQVSKADQIEQVYEEIKILTKEENYVNETYKESKNLEAITYFEEKRPTENLEENLEEEEKERIVHLNEIGEKETPEEKNMSKDDLNENIEIAEVANFHETANEIFETDLLVEEIKQLGYGVQDQVSKAVLIKQVCEEEKHVNEAYKESENLETITYSEEKRPTESLEENLEEEEKKRTTHLNEIKGKEIPEEKNLLKDDLNENIEIAEVVSLHESADETFKTNPLVEEIKQLECGEQDHVSKVVPIEQVYEKNKILTEEEKHVNETYEESRIETITEEHTSIEEEIDMQLTSRKTKVDVDKLGQACQPNYEEKLHAKDFGGYIDEEQKVQQKGLSATELQSLETKSYDNEKDMIEDDVLVLSNMTCSKEEADQLSQGDDIWQGSSKEEEVEVNVRDKSCRTDNDTMSINDQEINEQVPMGTSTAESADKDEVTENHRVNKENDSLDQRPKPTSEETIKCYGEDETEMEGEPEITVDDPGNGEKVLMEGNRIQDRALARKIDEQSLKEDETLIAQEVHEMLQRPDGGRDIGNQIQEEVGTVKENFATSAGQATQEGSSYEKQNDEKECDTEVQETGEGQGKLQPVINKTDEQETSTRSLQKNEIQESSQEVEENEDCDSAGLNKETEKQNIVEPANQISPKETNEDLVKNSLESQIFEKEGQEKILEKAEISVTGVPGEKILNKEEQEEKMQLDNPDLASEEKGLVITVLSETRSDDIDITDKLPEASNMSESKDMHIPKAVTDEMVMEAGEKQEHELQDETHNTLLKSEDEREISTGEITLDYKTVGTLEVYSELHTESRNTGSEESDTSKSINTVYDASCSEIGKLETPNNATLSNNELRIDKSGDEKLVNYRSDEACNTCTDTEKLIIEQDNSAEASKSSLMKYVEIEKAVVQLETGDRSEKPEDFSTDNTSTVKEENLELHEQLRSSSELADQDQRDKALPETSVKDNNIEYSDEKIIIPDLQTGELVMNKEVEEVHGGVELVEESENVIEQIREESCATELQTQLASAETINEINESDPVTIVNHEAIYFSENKETTSQAIEDVNWESEADMVTKPPEEEIDEGNEKHFNITSSALEASGEILKEENKEETDKCNGKMDTAPVKLMTEETSLEEIHLDDNPVLALDSTSDDRSLGVKTAHTIVHGAESDSPKLEECSCKVPQLITTEHAKPDNESGIVQKPDADEVEVEKPKTSNTATNSKEQNVEDILETGESLDRTDTHKVENELNEVLEAIAESKYQGVEAVIEGDVMSRQPLPTGNSTEQLVDPFSSMSPKEKDHETTLTEKCDDKSRKNDEILVNESSKASVATNAKHETCLLKENSRELEVSTSECEFVGNKEHDNPDEETKKEIITLHKATASEPEENSSKMECTEQNFDATCLGEETITEVPKDEPKPNQDYKTQGETVMEEEAPPNESTEHLVRNSKEYKVFEKETKEEILEDVEQRVMDITEETSLKKVERENIFQVNSTGLDSEDKGPVITGLQETGSDDVCIKAKIAEASEMGENKDVQIPKVETDEVSGAGEGTEQERENKTEGNETTNATSENVEASYTDTPLESDKKEENFIASRGIEKSSVNEKVQDEDKNLCTAPVLNSEKKISQSEEVEPANCLKSTDVSEFRDDDELETFSNEKLGNTELEKSTFEDEKTANDTNNAVPEQENSAGNSKSSLTEDVEIERAAVGAKAGDLSHKIEGSETNASIISEENFESIESCDQFRSASESVAENQSSKQLPQDSAKDQKSECREEKITGQDFRENQIEMTEEVELTSDSEKQINRGQDQIVMIKDVILTEEVSGGYQKTDESDYIKEEIIKEESFPKELQMASRLTEIGNEIKDSEPLPSVNLEAKEFSEDTETWNSWADESDKIKEEHIKEESFPKELQMASRLTEIGNEITDSEPLPFVNLEATEFSEKAETRNSRAAEYINWDLEASSNMKLPEEETKTCIEKPINITSSATEISVETVDAVNTGEVNDAPVTLKTEETSLEEGHKSVWACDTASDDKNLREITGDANLLGAGVGSLKFEESSGGISKLATTGQADTDKESAIVQNPDAEFEVEKIITSDAVSNPEEQIVQDILGQGKSPTMDRTGTDKPEEEINEVPEAICEPTYQGAEAFIEGDIIPNQTLSTGDSTDQLLEPSSSETRTTEESEQKSSKNNEALVSESSDGSLATSKEVTYLQKNEFRELEVSSLGLEENKKIAGPDEAKKEESKTLEETTTQSEPEENQSEKANEITKDKISCEQSTEEKEVVMDSPVASPDEETFRNSNQEDEVKIVECYGEITNQKGETMKNTILNEELSEELERADAGGERAVEDHHHSSAGNRTFTISPPQDAHEGENVEEAPIKIDLQRKNDGKDYGEPDKGETALSKEVNSSKVDLVKNGENILVAGDKEIMVRNYEAENLDHEISPVTDVVAEEANHEEVEEVFEPATKEPSHDTIETYDVQNEIENTNESESLEDDMKSMHTPLESALDRNCVQKEQRASAITRQFSTPTESLHEETEDRENGKTGNDKQHDFIPEEQARDDVSIPEEGMRMKDEGKHIKHESFILQEPIDLLTKEVRMKLDEAETKDGEIQDHNVSSHTKDSDKEASQKVDTVDVTKCGEISQYIDEDPLAIPDGQILIEPNSNESAKAKISTGNEDVSLVQQLESGNFLRAEPKGKGVECQEEKRTGEECKDTTEKPISTDSDKISSPDILEGSSEGVLNVAEDLTKERTLPENKEDLQDDRTETAEVEEPKKDEDKDEDVEGDENKRVDSGSDAPIMVEASRDMDIKVSPHKKSHTSILSGVGSKVKHSIAKVKKVITGKSSHPKPSSPK